MYIFIKFFLIYSIINCSLLAIDFETQIQPILKANCLQCHNNKNLKLTNGKGMGGISFEDKKTVFNKGIIIPKEAEKSLLYKVITLPVKNNENIKAMPLGGPRLKASSVKLIKDWINDGAAWSEKETSNSTINKKVFFTAKVKPLLEKNCIACHNPKSDKANNGGGLNLATKSSAFAGGFSGPVIIPNKPYQSLLYTSVILREDERFAMPPADRFVRLPKELTSILREWIELGAYWPDDVQLEFKKKKALKLDNINTEEFNLIKKIHAKIVATHQAKVHQPYIEELENGVEFTMIPIKAGSFIWKGLKKEDRLDVSLSAFWMGEHEVTWEEYQPFMESQLPREKSGDLVDYIKTAKTPVADLISRPTPPYHAMSYGMPEHRHPALSMTQHAANKYCQWLSYKTGHFYRLPTEAEWEYACRANTDTQFSWGDNPDLAHQYAWFSKNSNDTYHEVKTKKPNAFGLYDMHGNVSEWTLDQQVDNRLAYFNEEKIQKNPWIKATKPYPHVTKGGNWNQDVNSLHSSNRVASSPAWKASDPQFPKSLWYHTNAPWLGFRVVRPVEIPSVEEMYAYWNSGVEYDE